MEARPQIVSRGDGSRPEIALTFDDGPSPWTAEIASTFEKYGCRATFFLRGAAIGERPADVAALAASGHELGNHLWSHRDCTTMSDEELQDEAARTVAAIEGAGGGRPKLVRPPYLKGPEELADAVAGCGVRAVVLASVAAGDWTGGPPEPIAERVLAAAPGDIVCLHDGISPDRPNTDSRESTVAAIEFAVPALLDRGLLPVTVSRLIEGEAELV